MTSLLEAPVGPARGTTGERRRRAGARQRRHRALYVAGGVCVGLLVWEIAAVLIADEIFLPTPWVTVKELVHYMHTPYPSTGVPLWQDAIDSSVRILIGWGAGCIIGIVLGSVMIGVRFLRNMVDPMIEGIRPLPPLAFIPVLIVWFGVGNLPKIVLIMMSVFPLITISTVSALDQVPQEYSNVARCLGASARYVMVKVLLRAAVSPVITGMRVAMGVAWGSIVAAEMIVATNGLGYVILQAGLYLNTALIFSGIFCIGVLGIGFDAVLRLIQRRLDPTLRT